MRTKDVHALVTCRECGVLSDERGPSSGMRPDLQADRHLRANKDHYVVQRLHPADLCRYMDGGSDGGVQGS